MPSDAEGCRANARRCLEIASKTSMAEDTCEFLSLAESWQRIATEIEHNERLIALLDNLAASDVTKADTEQGLEEFSDHSSMRSVRRLATAIVSVSSHFVAEHFALVTNQSDQLEEQQHAAR